MFKLNDFSPYFMLVGKSVSKDKDSGAEKVYLHFIYQLSNGDGYGTYRTTKDSLKLKNIIPESDLVLGGVYDVRTDKFLNDKNQLITFLKDIRLVNKGI